MWKIFATLAFGIVAAAPSLDTALRPFDPSVEPPVVVANRNDETQAQSTKADRPEGSSKTTTGKQSHLRKASGSDTNGGFCESPDERARAHCLIYMKLREHRS
jgi:hypothetical protein